MTAPLLQVEGLVKHHGGRRWPVRSAGVRAVDGIDLTVAAGEIVAIVGETGSGKSTLGQCVLGLQRPTAGRVLVDGRPVERATERTLRRTVQPVFQDPYSSLDPRWPVGRTIREALDAQRIGTPAERRDRVLALLTQVGLTADHADVRPDQLSGGQRQRVAIAAALAPQPRLIVADEPVSALDVLVQAQILNLLSELRERLGLAILFITHDLEVVRHLADRVAVMHRGRIVEQAPTSELFAAPREDYTRTLLAARPPLLPDPDASVRRPDPTRPETDPRPEAPSIPDLLSPESP